MNEGQYIIYGILGIMILLYARKAWYRRSITSYTPAMLSERIRGPHDYVLLDVRTDNERKQGTIKGSHHIPLHQIVKRMGELEKHKGKEIVCFCQTGSRSISAAITLKKHGFRIANLEGGMAEWNFVNR
jgi:phage shock protein E